MQIINAELDIGSVLFIKSCSPATGFFQTNVLHVLPYMIYTALLQLILIVVFYLPHSLNSELFEGTVATVPSSAPDTG